jgi:uncharacterized membrane protein
MREKSAVIIISLILLAIGIIAFFIINVSSGFNFNKSELQISKNQISERLHYATNKPYHTLYRTFKSPITINGIKYDPSKSMDGFIQINSVSCNSGTPYATINHNCYFFPEKKQQTNCPYTEPNEYGCTFGNVYGFSKSRDYIIESNYELKPNNLFKINNKYYIKFVAYSKNNHRLLIRDKSLIIKGEVISKKYYLKNSNVIVYIPYDGDIAGFNIINAKKFDFDSSNILLSLLIFASPAIFFYLLWRIFGKENIVVDLPDQMSFYPRERKGWIVAAFFNPAFSKVDKNFFSAIMLDLYRKKAISTKMQEKDILIKINKTSSLDLDQIEKTFLHTLEEVYNKCPEKYKDGEYFNLKKASKSLFLRSHLRTSTIALEKRIKRKGKDYLDLKSSHIIGVISIFAIGFLGFFSAYFLSIGVTLFLAISFILIFLINFSTAILTKFKNKYYQEYRHWQAFKKYIKMTSLKEHGHKGIAIWEQHLVYASALGIAKKVLKEMKKLNMINESQYNFYLGMHVTSSSFATNSGASGSGGGVGGGGVGGGGGGGR